MKLIMENWRKYLLTEAMKDLKDLQKLEQSNKNNLDNLFQTLDSKQKQNKVLIGVAEQTKEGKALAIALKKIIDFKNSQEVDIGDREKSNKIFKGLAGDNFFSQEGFFANREWKKAKKAAVDAGYKESGDNTIGDILKFLNSTIKIIVKKQVEDNVAILRPIIIIDHNIRGAATIYYGALIKMGDYTKIIKMAGGVRSEDFDSKVLPKGALNAFPGGSINMKPGTKRTTTNECNNAWIVASTNDTTQGWGPLLYDIAIEYATLKANGLASDRFAVSDSAKKVWDYYMNKRSDVEGFQLDIDKGEAEEWGLSQLTPDDEKDDCNQDVAVQWTQGEKVGAWNKRTGEEDEVEPYSDKEQMKQWNKQSVSKSYKKDPTMIKKLGELGFLHAPDLNYNLSKKEAPKDKGFWSKFRDMLPFEE